MNRFVVFNALLFQCVWFASVLGGARNIWWWGALALIGLVAFSGWRRTLDRDFRLAVVLGPCGYLLDSVWATTGVLDFGSAASALNASGTITLAPVWITCLWVGVSFTLLHSLRLFAKKPWLGALLAGGAAIPSYLGGERLGAVVVPDIYNLLIVAVAWWAVFLMLFRWAHPQVVEEVS